MGSFAADLREASIVVAAGASMPAKKAAQMLREEIESRTQLRLPMVSSWDGKSAAIVLKTTPGKKPAEGFHVAVVSKTVTITGNDDRGLLFGAGYLLRQLEMSRQRLVVDSGMDVATAPAMPVRGHQLGYRPKTNSYDGWTVALWEQYIRELAIFGTNTIELIPPRSDDAADSPLFPLAQMDMMIEMSRIAGEYGLDVSVWYPAMDRDYNDPATVAKAIAEWGEVFRKLPRLDAVFVPGGDPGHTQPKTLFGLLEKQAANLRRYHPHARLWVSPQGFDKPWMDEFYGLMEKQPEWLAGIVYGPQNRDPLAEVRARVSKKYPIRFYPDITHSLHSQFPVPDWDAAFAATEGRETINPRPRGHAEIFRANRGLFDGFVTYSEGCNDDVNKIVWSGLGWDPNQKVETILREYARFFIGPEMAEPFARGLLSLEENWHGSLIANSSVDTTIAQFEQMQSSATPRQKLQWRFEQALYRANYDAFLRGRLIAETAQEDATLGVLRNAKQMGTLEAIAAAEKELSPRLTPAAAAYRARAFELAEGLFQSIRMQLSVARYNAIAMDRGANLDAIDFPLNNRVWLEGRFKEIRGLNFESSRLEKINEIVNWTNPGPGGFYDDLGDPAAQPHLVTGGALAGFGGRTPKDGWRVSWFTDAETLFDSPLRMHYDGLDPHANYKVRVVYGGDSPRVAVRLTANGGVVIHDYRPKGPIPEPLEFDIPPDVTRSGELNLEWTRTPGQGGSGRGCQVSEVWLIRKEGESK